MLTGLRQLIKLVFKINFFKLKLLERALSFHELLLFNLEFLLGICNALPQQIFRM